MRFINLFEDWDTTEANRKEARAKTDRNPTDAQKESGNYTKGKFWWNGLEVSIENPKGSKRSGTSKSGKKWETTMAADYCYIRRSISKADGDHIDAFVGPELSSQIVFIIDQKDPDTGKFDEHKCMLGYMNEKDAKKAYLESYSSSWDGFMKISQITLSDFKDWIHGGDTSKPYAP